MSQYATEALAVTNGDGGFLVSRDKDGNLAFPRIFALDAQDSVDVAEMFLQGLGLEDALVIDEYIEPDTRAAYIEAYSEDGVLSEDRADEYTWIAASEMSALSDDDAAVALAVMSQEPEELSERS